jgi:thiamine biosynthesis lipoprotein
MTSMLRRLALAACAATMVACSGAVGTPEPGAASASPEAGGQRLIKRAHTSMGSLVELSAFAVSEAEAVAAFDAAFEEFDRLDALLSVWKEGSDVVRLNGNAGRGPVQVSPDTIAVLKQAIQAGEWTDGKFDVTFGALSDVWKFDHDQDNRIPAPAEIAARLPFVDYRAIAVDETAGTAELKRAGMRVHLGGIGKGYAVDRAVAILRARGLRDFMVQSGGDLYVGGHNGNLPWRLGIRDPRGAVDQVFARLELSDSTFSTSGDYERFFMHGGVRYHHLLDPDTGQPARGARSVTVVAASAAVADALSTGVFVSGPEAGMALIERLPDVEGVIVTAKNELLISSGLRSRARILAEPTDAP